MTPPSSSANTASMRPRTTVPPMHHVERHLDVDGRAGRPRRHRERRLQFGELLGLRAAQLAVDRTRQVVEVEQPLGVEEPLHPVVKCRAQQGMRIRADRQPALQPSQRAVGIAAEVDQRAHRQLRRAATGGRSQRRRSRSASSASTSAAQPSTSSAPAPSTSAPPSSRCATSAAPRSTSPRRRPAGSTGHDRFDHLVPQRVRAHRRRARAPSVRRRRTDRPRRRAVDDVLDLAAGTPTVRAAWPRWRPSGDPTAAACPRHG